MISLGDVLLCLLLGAALWLVFDSLKARELGLAAARRACQREGLQFLDETVVGHALGVTRNDAGHFCFKRGFDFEYSLSGDDRYSGTVLIEGRDVVLVDLSQHRVQLLH